MQEAIKVRGIQEAPLFEGEQTYERITAQIGDIPFEKHPIGWTVMFGLGFAGTTLLIFALTVLLLIGTGIWGINQPVAWGFAIINFVWWIGIGHAGTLISAILLLMRQAWRMSINRFAEAMTIFAVMCAGLFPLFHTGRPWVAYWLFPAAELAGDVAAVPQPAGVGCVRCLHLLHRLRAILVYGADPRFGSGAGSSEEPAGKGD
jgi:hypothetical protein